MKKKNQNNYYFNKEYKKKKVYCKKLSKTKYLKNYKKNLKLIYSK